MNSVACARFSERFLPAYNNPPANRWNYGRKSLIARSLAVSEKGWKEKDFITTDDIFGDQFREAKERITQLCNRQNDKYAPNQVVQEIALKTLNLLRKAMIAPSLINPTNDESLLFEFFVNDSSYSIDFYNSGETVFLRRVKGHPVHVIEVDINQLTEVIDEIAHAYARVNL